MDSGRALSVLLDCAFDRIRIYGALQAHGAFEKAEYGYVESIG